MKAISCLPRIFLDTPCSSPHSPADGPRKVQTVCLPLRVSFCHEDFLACFLRLPSCELNTYNFSCYVASPTWPGARFPPQPFAGPSAAEHCEPSATPAAREMSRFPGHTKCQTNLNWLKRVLANLRSFQNHQTNPCNVSLQYLIPTFGGVIRSWKS